MALSDFISSVIGSNLISYSGWSASDTTFVSGNILRAYGVTLEADATDLTKLYALAKIESYKHLLALISTKYNFSADGGSFSRNQVYENVKGLYSDACSDGLHYYPAYDIRVGTMTNEESPYGLDSVTRLELGL